MYKVYGTLIFVSGLDLIVTYGFDPNIDVEYSSWMG